MTLTEFLAARLDEDQAMAEACPWSEWMVSGSQDYSMPLTLCGRVAGETWADLAQDVWRQGPDVASLRHAARHDPARVLREVEAKRARLALLAEAQAELDKLLADEHASPMDQAMAVGRVRGAWLAVRHDAAIWRDHPDYTLVTGR